MNFNYLRICFFIWRRLVCTRLPACYCLVLLICFFNNIFAQLWNGNLGTPVLNMAFSAGSSEPFPCGTTSYKYAHGCPPPGCYSIENVFKPDSYQLISFGIYNRYGVKVFSTTNAGTGWDGNFHGEPQATGTYVYYLEMKHASGKKITRKGSSLLLR